MNIVSFICFFICIGVLISCFRRDADIFSPGRIFIFVWSLTLGLADLKLSRLQDAWPLESWILLLLGPASFLTGIFIVHMLTVQQTVLPVRVMQQRWDYSAIDQRKLFTALCILFLLFLIGYVGIMLLGAEIPIVSARPGYARLKFQRFGIGLFLHNVMLIVYFSVLYHLVAKGKKIQKWFLIVASLSSVLLYVITLQRFQIIMAALMCIILLYYVTRHLRFSNVLIYSGIAFVFFFLISTLRGGQLFIYYLYIDSEMKFAPSYAIFTEPYMYFAMNLENFARAIKHLDEYTWGYYTFDFVTAVTGLKHWLGEYFGMTDTPYLTSGYNTYSAFWTYYRDFGVIGLLIFPLSFGFLIGVLYNRMKSSMSVQSLSLYAICLIAVAFSFFHNFFSFLWFIYDVAGVYFITSIVTKRARIVIQRI